MCTANDKLRLAVKTGIRCTVAEQQLGDIDRYGFLTIASS
jgi:hypothetical protein